MKVIRVHQKGGPEVLQLEDAPDPSPGPGELVIDVEAVGVNFIEIYYREGLYPMEHPFTPGSEAAGTIAAVGAGVTEFQVGDRVACAGVGYASHAEVLSVPKNLCVHLPQDVSFESGAYRRSDQG